MPKISVITTTYKHQDFIAKTIESILAQTFSDWELLIGDDSPDNNTWNIITYYTNKYPDKIKYWHHEENKGIVGNMNFLLEKVNSESEYIAFLEGDDIYTPENLEKKLKIFEKYNDVVLIYNNLDFIDGEGIVFDKDFLKKAPFYLKNQKLKKEQFIKYETFYGSYSTLMIKKEILYKEKIINPTNDKLYSVSDWDLFFRLSTKYNCYGIEDTLTLYRRHQGNVTSDNTKIVNDLIKYMENYMDIEKNKIYFYKLYRLKMYSNYLIFNKIKTIEYGIISFKYSITKNFIERIGMILFSLLPNKFNNYLYNKFKK